MTHAMSQPISRTCRIVRAGLVEYQAAWDWQRHLAAERSARRCDDTLLLLEHPPTITLGRAADQQHILLAPDELARRGVAVVAADRGGDVTYHAPGQVVGYPILKLSRYGGGLLRYLRNLEEVLIQVLARYGIAAGRVGGLTGVWVNTATATSGEPAPLYDDEYDAKVAAIGVRLSASGITSHGFALNVAPDLRGFEQIVPCGIQNRRVTSMEQLLGSAPDRDEVTERIIERFSAIFDVVATCEEIEWLNTSP